MQGEPYRVRVRYARHRAFLPVWLGARSSYGYISEMYGRSAGLWAWGPVVMVLALGGCAQLLPAGLLASRDQTSSGDPTGAGNATSQSAVTGQVIGLDGQPAAGVRVRAFAVPDAGQALVGNNAGGLVSNNSAALTNSAPLTQGAAYRIGAAGLRIQTAGTEAVTDAQGRFQLAATGTDRLNVEAVLSDDVRAISQGVTAAGGALKLQLDHAGWISGRVVAPGAPTVKDFTGVDVYVPGTSYLAKTDAAGAFTLSHVAVGTFALVASKAGLGTAVAPAVSVRSRSGTAVQDLVLSALAPSIATVTPANGGPGTIVTLKGERFGATTGETFLVTFGGAAATRPERLDDGTIRAIVPGAGDSGDVVVSVGGMQSLPARFQVIGKLLVGPDIPFLGIGATQSFAAVAQDAKGNPIATPNLEWAIDGAAVKLDGPIATGVSVGTATLRVAAGTVAATLSIAVTDQAIVATVAGNGDTGLADGGPAKATFNWPTGIAAGDDGTVYVADTYNYAVRRITPDGQVSTLAGLKGEFEEPIGIASAPSGELYVADGSSNRILRVTLNSQVQTVAQGADKFNRPQGVAVDPNGTLYIADTGNNRILALATDGQIQLVAGDPASGSVEGFKGEARFNYPTAVAIGPGGTLLVADTENHRIRRITPSGDVTTLAGSTRGYSDTADGLVQFSRPQGIAVDTAGTVFVTDTDNHRIRRIAASSGEVTTLAGGHQYGYVDGLGPDSRFAFPMCLTWVGGKLVVTDYMNQRIRRIDNLR